MINILLESTVSMMSFTSSKLFLIFAVISLALFITVLVFYIKLIIKNNKNKNEANIVFIIQSIISLVLILTSVLLNYFMPNIFGNYNWYTLDLSTTVATNIVIVNGVINIFLYSIIILMFCLRTKKIKKCD